MQDVKEMREVYCDSLIEMAATDPRIVVVEADLMNCIKTGPFKKAYPDRFFDVGVAEANMIGISAGLATCGKIPFCSSFGTFATRRCYDQIFISVAYSKQNVKIVGTDPGIAAEINGGTHMPFEDMGIMRGIPGMVCVEPTDCAMLKSLMPQIVEHKGPVYIRLFRKKTEKVFEDGAAFDLFKAFTLRKGTDVTIIASGIMVSRALEAADLLKERGISAEVINVYTWKPIDEETIARSPRSPQNFAPSPSRASPSKINSAKWARCPTSPTATVSTSATSSTRRSRRRNAKFDNSNFKKSSDAARRRV